MCDLGNLTPDQRGANKIITVDNSLSQTIKNEFLLIIGRVLRSIGNFIP